MGGRREGEHGKQPVIDFNQWGGDAPRMDLELFRVSFARVSDAYGIEMPSGRPKAERRLLTDELLRDHLAGKIRIGAYTTDVDGLADQIIIDIDIPKEKVNDPAEWERARTEAKRVLVAFDEHGIKAFVTSSKSRGYHVRYLWEPSPAATLRKVGEYIARRAGIQAEVFPKQDKRTEDGLGNFVWLPLHGESLKAGKTAILSEGNGLDPMPDQWETLRNIGRNSHETLATVQAIVEEEEKVSGRIVPAVQEVRDKIIEGKRRDTLTSIAGTLRRRGLDEREILPTLLEVNRTRCVPPIAEKDVSAIARSIMRYPAETPLITPNEVNSGAAENAEVKKRVPLFDDVGRTLRAGGIPAPIWLVNQLIERGVIQLFGPPGSMKSFIAMLLAYCLATGRPFFGRKVDAGPVFYTCGEGRAGAWRRMASLEVHYGVKIPEGSLFLSRHAVTLDAASVDGLCDEIKAAISTGGRPPVLIVIDTLARSLVGDENSQKDMSEFINAVEKISTEFGCAALVVHHSGHSEDAKNRGRGSSVLLGACDSIIKCADRMLTWQKTKDAEPPEPIVFGFKVIPLGLDAEGEPIDSGVIVDGGEGVASHTDHVWLEAPDRLALETLVKLSAKGELRADLYWVGLDEWRAEFVRFHCGDNKKSKYTAHLRSREKLNKMGLVSVDNN